MSIEFGTYLKQRATGYKQRTKIFKEQKYFSLPDHQLAENLILVFGFCERTKQRYKRICN